MEYTTVVLPPNQDNTVIKKRRRFVLIIVAAIVVIIAIITLLITHGGGTTLTVNTDKANTVTALLVKNRTGDDENSKGVPAITLQANKAGKLQTGKYIVRIQNSFSGTSQTITVHSGSNTLTVKLGAVPLQPEPVADVNALYFTVGQSDLKYIDQSTNNLYQINQNILSANTSQVAFSTVHWADASFGVGQDNDGNLYTIINNVVQEIILPLGVQPSGIAYDVASNHAIYLLSGKSVYLSNGNGFKKIYNNATPNSTIVASADRFALAYSPGDGNYTAVNRAPEAITTVDNQTGKTQKIALGSYEIAWSPNGQFLAKTNDVGTEIYDNSLKQIAVVPHGNVNNLTWLDNNTIFYNVGSQLWEYTVSTQKSSIIANTPVNNSINNIVVSPDKAYVYLSVEHDAGSSNDLEIERVGVQGQQPSSNIAILHKRFPYLISTCISSLVNFQGPPTVQIYGGEPEDDCLGSAKNYVEQTAIDSNVFNYAQTDVPPNEPVDQ